MIGFDLRVALERQSPPKSMIVIAWFKAAKGNNRPGVKQREAKSASAAIELIISNAIIMS